MDKKVKERWVKALRSGEYNQAQGVLYDYGGSYCCLGVLCKIETGNPYSHQLGEDEVLNDDFLNRVGLTSNQQDDLVLMNDGNGEWSHNPQSFSQIADYIEKNL